ncbi:YciI family protein [Dactylosporangium darangshiense]|uniref:YciI family protein n=1 Tax=Dactylosporangium darangshiense TaxID=579108 RepID=A0ABP8DHL4_9ACTN
MKYLIMIYSNPASRAAWAGFDEEQRRAGYAAHEALRAEMAASGELVGAEALQQPESARIVAVRGGRAQVTDGPFAEVKEHLAGYYLVECDSIDRAVELAGRIPEAEFVTVEVRPVVSLR